MTGYEIKVSRSDFLSDQKWHLYLNLCNVFYFAAAPGIIQEGELPDGVGLMVLQGQGNGVRMITKKKAAYRQVEIPENLFRYVLMCRAKIGADHGSAFERAKAFLSEKEEREKVGLAVRYQTRELMDKIRSENADLKKLHEKYEDVRKVLQELGIRNIDRSWRIESEIKEAIERKRALLTPELLRQLESAERSIKQTRDLIAKEVTA